MGVYDCYGRSNDDERFVQLKVGPCELKSYIVGDKANIPDGIYVGYEGIVTIYDGTVVGINTDIYDKWGGLTKIDLDVKNPLAKICKEFEREKEVIS